MTCITTLIENEANILQKTALQSMPQDGLIFGRFGVDCWMIFGRFLAPKSSKNRSANQRRAKMQQDAAKMAPSALQEGRWNALVLAIPSKIAPRGRP